MHDKDKSPLEIQVEATKNRIIAEKAPTHLEVDFGQKAAHITYISEGKETIVSVYIDDSKTVTIDNGN